MVKTTPDAAESSAGDDFHILWAMRKSLELLNFDPDGVKKITLEGMTSKDTESFDQDDDLMLGVDLTEYFSGEDFSSASRVIFSQLKYSTRLPHIEWTAARICQGKKKGSKGSVIDRLSSFFKGIYEGYGRDAVLAKSSIKLVSNRPASPVLLSAVSNVQKILATMAEQKDIDSIKRRLPVDEQDVIDRIWKASGLDKNVVTDFLLTLDFLDCNAGARFEQRKKAMEVISNLGGSVAQKEYDVLRGVVWDKMMPDVSRDISLTDIIYPFGCTTVTDMFPVNPSFEEATHLIIRNQQQAINATVVTEKGKLLCIDGGAGIGKSTIAKEIARHFSKDHIVILFDCYGGGSFLAPEDKRHRHFNALLQIINELALRSGTPFLLIRDGTDDFYIREFKKRLEIAGKSLVVMRPDTHIIFIVDAADNSVVAAKNDNSRCFVHDLVQMQLPDCCRIVVTTRTERKEKLKLPDTCAEIKINTFDAVETGQFLQGRYGNVSPEQVDDFRQLTLGIPRVMAYVLDLPMPTLEEKLKPLKPGGKSLDDIFKLRIKYAADKTGDRVRLKKFLINLICLPRPIPIAYIASLTGISATALEDFHVDLWHGLRYEHEKFSIRDEDFETFVRSTYQPAQADLNNIADKFLDKAESDEYASIHLGVSLYHAGKKNLLQRIVVEKQLLEYPKDAVKNREVFVNRTRLAMLLAKEDSNSLNFLKLLAVAAEAAKTNKILEEILLNKSELAVSYGNLETIQKMYFQKGNPEWFGPVHFRSAAIFSRKKETHESAKQHLNRAEQWLNYRRKLTEEERKRYSITDDDIAYGAEAVLRVFGPEACIMWINRWLSKEFRYEIVRSLLPILLENSTLTEIKAWLKGRRFRADVELLIVNAFFERGLSAPTLLDGILDAIPLFQRAQSKLTQPIKNTILSFCEYAAMKGVHISVLKPFLDLWPVNIPAHIPSFYDHEPLFLRHEKTDIDFEFRKAALQAHFSNTTLEVDQFLPDRVRDEPGLKYEEKSSRDNNRREFYQLYRHLLPMYQTRIAFLLGKKKKIRVSLKKIVTGIDKDYDFYHRNRHDLRYIYQFIALRLLDIQLWSSDHQLLSIIKNGFAIPNQLYISLPLSLAQTLSGNAKFHPDVLQLLQETDLQLQENIINGEEKIGYYTTITSIGSRVSEATGKYYFDKMVACSESIDLSAHYQIKCLHQITSGIFTFESPKLAFETARFTEYCYEHLSGYDHFPWKLAFETILRLDIGSAFAILSRWDHRNTQHISDHFTELLQHAVEQSYLTASQAAALLPINKYYWPGLSEVVKSILIKFDEEGNKTEKNIFLHTFIRDVHVNFGPGHQIELLKNLQEVVSPARYVKQEIKDAFKTYHAKIVSLLGIKKKPAEPDTRKYKTPNLNRQYQQLSRKTDITSSVSIDNYFTALRKLTKNEWVNDSLALATLKGKVKTGQHSHFLDTLIDLQDESLDFYSFRTFITSTIKEWDIYPEIKKWKKANFKRVIVAKMNNLTRYGSFDFINYRGLATSFGLTATELAQVTISIIPDYVDGMESSILYDLFQVLLADADKTIRQTLLEWLLRLWNAGIKDDFGDGPFTKKLSPPATPADVITYFLRYNIGHPDKRLRWRASHSLRRFALFSQHTIFENLLRIQNSPHNNSFQYASYPFFWLSAKLYLWIAIDRICAESPQVMMPIRKYFIPELNNTVTPHAQIIYFVRNSCLKLLRVNKDSFNKREKEIISACLTNTVSNKLRKIPIHKTKQRYPRLKTKFPFDTMDTVPYWYDSLGSVFGLSGNTIAALADKFIGEDWGYTGDPRKDEHVKSDRNYYLTSNDHGSEPTIETLRKYYEYHSMFCVAMELLKSRPVAKSDSYYEKWEYWIRGWGLWQEDSWLADLRDPFPAIEKLWTGKRHERDWEWSIQRKDFDVVLGLSDKYNRRYIAVNLSSTIYYHKDYESSRVESGLVPIQTGPALLRALQTGNRFDCQIPLEKEENDDDEWAPTEHSNTPFKIEGWIRHTGSDYEGIDDTDAAYRKFEKTRVMLGKKIVDQANLQYTDDLRYSFQQMSSDKPVSILEVWNDMPDNVAYGDYASGGRRLLIRKDILLSFLKAINQCLIVKVELYRRPDRQEYHSEFSYYTFIYLIYPNGKIETITGDTQLR